MIGSIQVHNIHVCIRQPRSLLLSYHSTPGHRSNRRNFHCICVHKTFHTSLLGIPDMFLYPSDTANILSPGILCCTLSHKSHICIPRGSYQCFAHMFQCYSSHSHIHIDGHEIHVGRLNTLHQVLYMRNCNGEDSCCYKTNRTYFVDMLKIHNEFNTDHTQCSDTNLVMIQMHCKGGHLSVNLNYHYTSLNIYNLLS